MYTHNFTVEIPAPSLRLFFPNKTDLFFYRNIKKMAHYFQNLNFIKELQKKTVVSKISKGNYCHMCAC